MADINLGVGGANSAVAGGYTIDNSFVQEYNSTRRVSMLYGGFGGSAPTNTKATISFWFKWAGTNAGGANWKMIDTQNSQFGVINPDDATYQGAIYCAGQNESLFKLVSTAKFRDTSAWYHMCAIFDSTLSTASDRVKIYVNGVRVTDFTTANYPAQNASFRHIGENTSHHVGHDVNIGKPYAYFADMYYIFDQAKDVTDFGEFDADTGIWKPIEYTGTFGSYGYYWDFSNASNYAEDQSGTASGTSQMIEQSVNTTTAMQSTDTPTNNFCTINVLQNTANYNTNVTTEGATEVYSTSNYSPVEASIGVMGGKWYWEGKYNVVNVGHMPGIGVGGEWVYTAFFYVGRNDYGIGTLNGNWYYNGAVASSTDASSWSTGDIVSFALDMDNYKIYMAVNGSWAGTSNPATNTGGYDFSGATNLTSNFVVPVGRIETANASYPMELNFGGYTSMSIASGNSDANGYGNFEYAPPSGYYALCSKNLAQYG